MKLVKSLLLGSTVGIVAAAGAQAADLPSRKAAPVEYVRICDAYGAGFFYIPGTDTCIKFGGFVRGEGTYLNSRNTLQVPGAGFGGAIFPAGIPTPTVATVNAALAARVSSRALDETGFRGRGRFQFDVRNQTAWGTLRAFARFDFTRDTGVYANGNPPTLVGTSNAGLGRTSYLSVRYVFIQWAGITAGRYQSFFDFQANAYNFERVRGSDQTTNGLAYTATFGGGFSATLSIEDRNERFGQLNFNTPASTGGFQAAYAGTRSPDFVGALRVDQAWGSAQISGAAHAINSFAGLPGVTVPSVGIGQFGTANKNREYGYAVQAGVAIKLPMLAAGDEVYLQGAYSRGALDYLGATAVSSGNVSGGFLGRFHGGLLRNDTDLTAFQVFDAAGNTVGYTTEKTRGYVITGGFRHFWAPNFNQAVYASYLNVMPGSRTRNTSWLLGGLGRAREVTVGTTLTYTPVAGFDIGLDLIYARLRQDLAQGPNLIVPLSTVPGIKKDVDTYEARLRFQRAF